MNSAAELDDDAARLYVACVAKLRAVPSAVDFVGTTCTLFVEMRSNANMHISNEWYCYELGKRLERQFAADYLAATVFLVEDVGCGAAYRRIRARGDLRALCCCTSWLCCCIPLLTYWLPMCVYHRVNRVFAYRYGVRLRLIVP